MTSIFESVKKSRKRYQERLMVEAGFSRLMRVITGLVPSVRTFAIISWENPHGDLPTDEMLYKEFGKRPKDKKHRKKKQAAWNNRREARFERSLKAHNIQYKQIKGRYKHYENPFICYNINRPEAVMLGKRGRQESVLYAEVMSTPRQFSKVRYALISSEEGREGDEIASRTVWRYGAEDPGETPEEDDMYSEYEGRRFYIPFFDKKYKKSRFVHKGKGVEIAKMDASLDSPLEVKSQYRIFTEEDVGKQAAARAESLWESWGGFSDNSTGKHMWLMRGDVFNFLMRSLGEEEI